ncbi:MAG: FmdB family zinc ribbon protein [Armatimonadota bacterium]
MKIVPTYGYQCSACKHTFEIVQKITDEPLTQCEKCNGEVRRLLYPAGIIFKGSGFHVNDYRKSDNPACETCPSACNKSE